MGVADRAVRISKISQLPRVAGLHVQFVGDVNASSAWESGNVTGGPEAGPAIVHSAIWFFACSGERESIRREGNVCFEPFVLAVVGPRK